MLFPRENAARPMSTDDVMTCMKCMHAPAKTASLLTSVGDSPWQVTGALARQWGVVGTSNFQGLFLGSESNSGYKNIPFEK